LHQQPNADGSYPVPDAANPSTYPLFPFAHPPYSCRAFAYLSVATFDGMIAAWHYKYKYNRPSIKSMDASIEPFYGDSGLPTYPSEGAVITATAQTVLSAMFPLEKEYIAQKAAEHLASLTYTASALKSDIDAGTKLGTEVAKLALSRASTDGMKKAQTSKAVADSIKNAAITRFGWSYQSMEIPERKIGITANFGQVKTWAVKDLVAIRPPVPPALDSDEFKKDVDELLTIAKNRSSDQRRIANFWADGTSTYTPPGHWNRIACTSIVGEKYNPLRTARTLAYMNMAIMDAGIACWDAKYYYHYPRPVQTIPGFKAILGTPNFPSYVSGHSTFSSAGAAVLSFIFPQAAATFDAYAKDASDSRIYGGIHYRFDCEEGLKLGQRVAKETIDIAVKDGAK
jgi:PAP2 superfamily